MVESFENRDLQCANEVAEMARLGKFDTEFLIFGSAVQEINGKIYYYATTNQEKLYDCICKARSEERYFMPMVRYMRRLQIPADLREEWTAKMKLALIQRMKQQYDTYLPKMAPFFQEKPSDVAVGLLANYQDAIDGYFDDVKLQLFWGLVEMSYERKILSAASYRRFKEWHDKVRRQMRDDPTVADSITRIFYGFVYWNEQRKRIAVFDAQEVGVVEKQREKLMQGYIVAPIVKKQYAFRQFSEMPKVRQSYREWLLSVENDEYLALVENVQRLPSVIDEKALQKIAEDVQEQEYAAYATAYFQSVWNKRNNM